MNYVKIYVDALSAYKRLSDTEFGRAIRALLQYVEDGTEPNLPGKESIMFDVLREQVKRGEAAYEAKVSNGKKGGRPKKTENNLKNLMVFPETENNLKNQYKENNNIPPYNPPKGEDEAEEAEFLAQNALLNEVFDKAERCGFAKNEASRDALSGYLHDYGKDALFYALDECVKSQVISFRYLEKVLGNAKPPEKKHDYAADYL